MNDSTFLATYGYDLRDFHAAPSGNEPKFRYKHHRDAIRHSVRANLLRGRTIEESLSQTQRRHGYGEETKALIIHFYNYEKIQ